MASQDGALSCGTGNQFSCGLMLLKQKTVGESCQRKLILEIGNSAIRKTACQLEFVIRLTEQLISGVAVWKQLHSMTD
jgi:hypothetical protein